jgi:hypothetical protein
VDGRLQQPRAGVEIGERVAVSGPAPSGQRRYNAFVQPSAQSATSARDPAHYRALVHPPGARYIEAIDQRALPHSVVTARIADADMAALAIRRMWVRGAPLIGAVGAYGMALALDRDATDASLAKAHAALDATRPTAVNLRWALDRVRAAVLPLPERERADAAWNEADAICGEDEAINHAIGLHGLELLRDISRRRAGPVNVMTHCNAGRSRPAAGAPRRRRCSWRTPRDWRCMCG